MQQYVLTTTLSGGHDAPVSDYDERAAEVKKEVESVCPEVEWLTHYVVLGPFDFLDIIAAPDTTSALKAAAAARHAARADVRVYPIEAWKDFKQALPR